jgi:PAS domain S-box-containing protein
VDSALADWLVSQRTAIEREAGRGAGPLAPASAEAEALRRFRSFALLSLARGEAEPSLEGLRVSSRRSAAAIDSWIGAASALAGPDGERVRTRLDPLRARFCAALGATAPARRAAGTVTASQRRAVPAAIDRVADVFLAVDVDSRAVVDANPAACALLGLSRPELLATEIGALVDVTHREAWHAMLDSLAEGAEPRRARAALKDGSGAPITLDVRATRAFTRGRTLALLVARPAD